MNKNKLCRICNKNKMYYDFKVCKIDRIAISDGSELTQIYRVDICSPCRRRQRKIIKMMDETDDLHELKEKINKACQTTKDLLIDFDDD